MAIPQTTKLQIKFRTKWWQFWLPEHITLVMDNTPYIALDKAARAMRAQAVDLGDMLIYLNEEMDGRRKDPIIEALEDRTVPLQPLPGEIIHPQPEAPLHIPIIDEDDDDQPDGGDFVPEVSSNVVEFDRDASPSWTPDQSGGVVVKQPPIITQMRNNARNDMRKLQK